MTSTTRYRVVLLGLLVMGLLALATPLARGATPVGQPTAGPTVEPKGQRGCAVGTVVGGASKVVNGDFSIPAGAGPGIDPVAGFYSELPNVGPQTHPNDNASPRGGFSIITGDFNPMLEIVGRPFPGDPQRDVAASPTYFYSNPNQDVNGDPIYHDGKGYAILWRQDVTLTVGTTYNFFAYFDNLLDPSLGNYGADPVIELRVNGVVAGNPIAVEKTPDAWVPVQFSFKLVGATEADVGTQATVTLEIRDYANDIAGDDFGMTGINLKQCVSGLGVALGNLLPIDNGDGTYDIPFIVTLKNFGVDELPLSKLQVTADLATAFSGVQAFEVRSIASESLTVNEFFDGDSDKTLLSGENSLSLDPRTATVEFTVRVTPGTGAGALGPFNIQLHATADAGTETSGAIEVTDVSVPGFNPDPNDDQSIKDPDEDQPTPVYLVPFKYGLPLVMR